MAFIIKDAQIDLGQTSIENIFIHDFMPMANGTFVKVYLLGYYFAKKGNMDFDNQTLAKHLEISIEDVVNAWQFWCSKGIVACDEVDKEQPNHLFNVTFLSIRDMYITNNFRSGEDKTEVLHTRPSDRLLSAMTNPVIKKMLADIQHLVRRMLTPQETTKILDWMTNYKIDADLMERAFHITYEEKAIKSFQFEYVEGILKKWYDHRILTMDELETFLANKNTRYTFYKKVLLAMGINQKNMPVGIKEVIDTWCETDEYSEDYILFVIKEATKRTNNPNINYIKQLFENIKSQGNTSVEGAKVYFESARPDKSQKIKKSNVKTTRTNFQNFSQSTISAMSEEQLTDIIKRKLTKRNLGD